MNKQEKKLTQGLALWLKAALDCKDYDWDPDQRAAAQELVDEAIKQNETTIHH